MQNTSLSTPSVTPSQTVSTPSQASETSTQQAGLSHENSWIAEQAGLNQTGGPSIGYLSVYVQIYVGTGLISQEAAEALIYDMPEKDGSRAQPIDWDKHATDLDSETPKGWTGNQERAASSYEILQAHQQEEIEKIWGAGLTLGQVEDAIPLASYLGRGDLADEVQNLLFRAQEYALVATLNPEDSDRYAPGGGKTYCNIYAYDFVTAMGAWLPRVWWSDKAIQDIQAGKEVAPVYGETVFEMQANGLTKWFHTWGASYGWGPASDMTDAQEAANQGNVVIIVGANKDSSRSGHISVVVAESPDHQATRVNGQVTVPVQSQAGRSPDNFSDDDTGNAKSTWWSTHKDAGAWIFTGQGNMPLGMP